MNIAKQMFNRTKLTSPTFVTVVHPFYSQLSNQVQLTSAFKNALEIKLRNKDWNQFLRLQILAGQGCQGYTYKFKFDSQLQESDLVVQLERMNKNDNTVKKTVSFAVNGEDLKLLEGATLDYAQEMMRQTFYVKENPNAQISCGCKTSFSPKEYLL